MTAKVAEKKKVGRKTKLVPQVTDKLFEALELGATRRAACAYAGISESTLYEWIDDFPEFLESCTRAEDSAEMGFTRVIQQCAMNGDWKAAESWLKRRRRGDWSDGVDHTSSDGSMTPTAIQIIPYVKPDSDSA